MRSGLEPLPAAMRPLPAVRGYPVPFFVEWTDGTPRFDVLSGDAYLLCVEWDLCWICGNELDGDRSFVGGPSMASDRLSFEPPSHPECAEWAARNCPFLAQPHRRRSSRPKPDARAVGVALPNPGLAVVWTTRTHQGPWPSGVFTLGDAKQVSWWREGRPATASEVAAAAGTIEAAKRGHD